MIAFICEHCVRKQHGNCPGDTWCDCQHGRKKIN